MKAARKAAVVYPQCHPAGVAEDEHPVPVIQIIPLIRRSVSAMILEVVRQQQVVRPNSQKFAEVELLNTKVELTL